METEFKVKTHTFEGPLDLLLELIEKRKLHISEISLAEVADDYVAYIENIEDFPMEESAHFILTASTLLLIKSKSLLPTLDLTLEEEQSIEELEDRLKQYQKIKELSRHVESMFGASIMFAPERESEHIVSFSPTDEISLTSVYHAVLHVVQSLPKKEVLSKVVVDKVISLEETMEELTERVKRGLQMSFKEFSQATGKGATEIKAVKMNMVVSFLAMLELVKRGSIFVSQDKEFGDITMNTSDVGVPHYK